MSKLCLSRAAFQPSSCSNADFKDIHQTHLRTVFTDYDATCAHGKTDGIKVVRRSCSTRDIKYSFLFDFYGILRCSLRTRRFDFPGKGQVHKRRQPLSAQVSDLNQTRM